MGSHTMEFFKTSLVFALCIQTMFAAEIHSEANPCSENWVQATWVDMGCLLFNDSASYTWEEANGYCQGENASLIEILTEEQFDFVNMELDVLTDHDVSANYWWTAGTDIGREGKWLWIGSTTPVDEFVWLSGYPTSSLSRNCLTLSPTNNAGVDKSCSSKYFSICQQI